MGKRVPDSALSAPTLLAVGNQLSTRRESSMGTAPNFHSLRCCEHRSFLVCCLILIWKGLVHIQGGPPTFASGSFLLARLVQPPVRHLGVVFALACPSMWRTTRRERKLGGSLGLGLGELSLDSGGCRNCLDSDRQFRGKESSVGNRRPHSSSPTFSFHSGKQIGNKRIR